MSTHTHFIEREPYRNGVRVKSTQTYRATTDKVVDIDRQAGEDWLTLTIIGSVNQGVASIPLVPDDARTVARNILAIADRIDAEKAAASFKGEIA